MISDAIAVAAVVTACILARRRVCVPHVSATSSGSMHRGRSRRLPVTAVAVAGATCTHARFWIISSATATTGMHGALALAPAPDAPGRVQRQAVWCVRVCVCVRACVRACVAVCVAVGLLSPCMLRLARSCSWLCSGGGRVLSGCVVLIIWG